MLGKTYKLLWLILLAVFVSLQACKDDNEENEEPAPDLATEIEGLYVGDFAYYDFDSTDFVVQQVVLGFERSAENKVSFVIDNGFSTEFNILGIFNHNGSEIMEFDFVDTSFQAADSQGNPVTINVIGLPKSLYGKNIDGAFNRTTKGLEINFALSNGNVTMPIYFIGTLQSASPARIENTRPVDLSKMMEKL